MAESLNLTISKYRQTRFWGLYLGDELLAVVTYRKGARSLKAFIESIVSARLEVAHAA